MAGNIGDHFRDVRETHKKRKRASDQTAVQNASQIRQHQRKSSLNNRTFSLNVRRSLDNHRSNPDTARKSTNEQRQQCYDWIIQGNGAHYARNRASFAEYTQVHIQLANGMWLQGIGTVHLDILKGPDLDDGVDSIILKDVLHLPNALCNGISIAQYDDKPVSWSPLFGCRDPNGDLVWLGNEYCGVFKLGLAGDPHGESLLQDAAFRGVEVKHTLLMNLTDHDVQCIKAMVSTNAT